MEDVINALADAATILPPRARGNCRIWFKYRGEPVFISAGTKKPKEARQVARDKIRAWLTTQPKEAPQAPAQPATAHPWKPTVQRYLSLEHEHSKEGTREEAGRNLDKLGAALGWPDAATVTKALYREKYPALRDAVAPKTWANELGEHRRFAEWLVVEEIILRNFTDGVKRPPRSSFGRREEIYRDEWFQPIWEALELKWRPWWEDHWFTGMDTKDLWEFQPRKHMAQVGAKWKIWKQRAKEAEWIDQPLSSRIAERWAKRWGECGPEDFLHPMGRRYANAKSLGNQLRKAVHGAQAKLGLPKLDVKTTRHAFATRHLLRLVRGEKNAPTLDEVRRWLGHARDSRELERTYAKLLSNPHLMD